MTGLAPLIYRRIGGLVCDLFSKSEPASHVVINPTHSIQRLSRDRLQAYIETPSPRKRGLRYRFRTDRAADAGPTDSASGANDVSEDAEARARRLLLRMLSPAQRAQFQGYGFFCVDVPMRNAFCILPRHVFNVLDLWTGDHYCCTAGAILPLSDVMLTQKLLLENDPQQFFSVANRRPAPNLLVRRSGRGAPA